MHMWSLESPWWALIARSLVVYCFLIVMPRITSKEPIGQLAPFDMGLLLVLSNTVENSITGGDNSLTGGLVSAATLIALNHFVERLTFKSKRLERLIEGTSQLLIHNGILNKSPSATHHELALATTLRQAECASVEEVHPAVLKTLARLLSRGASITISRHSKSRSPTPL